MTLRFDNPRHPTSRADLSDAELEQLVVVGERADGEQRDAADWLAPEVGLSPELWDVKDASGRVLYQCWLHHEHRGVVFRAGTTDVVAEIDRGGVVARDLTVEADLARAAIPHDASSLAGLDFARRA